MKVNYNKNDNFRDFLRHKIKSFNNDHSPYHMNSRNEDSTKYIEIEEKKENHFLAGASASIYWNMMFIEILFVDEAYRKTGLGSKILSELISIAKNHQCHYIALETYSFQAKDFYERSGFRVVGELVDYPPGESFYTMRLDL